MEARHGRKLGSAAYEIAHDTEPPGRLAPEVSLSRIRGLTCEILAHAPTPLPSNFPSFLSFSYPPPSLLLSTTLSLLLSVKHPSPPTDPRLSLIADSVAVLFSPKTIVLSLPFAPLAPSPPPFCPRLDKLLRMASCERQVSSVSPAWHGTLPGISPVSKFEEWIDEGGEGKESSINIGGKCRGRFLLREDNDFDFLITHIYIF